MTPSTQARKRTNNEKDTIRVVVVDDHPIMRHGLVQLLARDETLEVCGEADNAESAIALVAELKPDLVTLDLSLPGKVSGLDLLSKIVAAHEGVKVLVLSMLDEAMYAESVLQRGAQGFLEKDRATEQLLAAVRDVLAGRLYVPAATRDRLLSRAAHPQREGITNPVMTLSPRELQVFELIGKGLSTDQTASELQLSPKTVHTHRQHIMEKLSLLTSNQLVVHAASWVNQKSSGDGPAARDDVQSLAASA
jgi:DNA-binding NarL/FixJ family response regulator